MDFINLVSTGIIGLIGYAIYQGDDKKKQIQIIQAISQINGTNNKVSGTVRFTASAGSQLEQSSKRLTQQINSTHSNDTMLPTTVIELDIQGLEPNTSHGFHVHEKPIKLSDSCDQAGPHFDSHSSPHGGPFDKSSSRHIGDLGNILADANGRVQTKFSDYLIELTGPDTIIGRTIVIHEFPDDFKTIESSGKRIACGLITGI
jgi:Cu-Zn family superoxide dismutase